MAELPGDLPGELPDELGADLGELDACFASVPLPERLEARIVAGTMAQTEKPSRLRWSLGVGLAFVSGVVLSLLVLRAFTPEPARQLDASADRAIEAPAEAPAEATPPSPRSAAQPAPGLSLEDGDCEWSRVDELLELAIGCRARLAQPAMVLEIWTPARVELIADGVAVHEGEVMFLVEHIEDPRIPAKVGVSGGTIEILGTRFVVSQNREGGRVDLIEGAIQFRRLDGEVEAVEPGRRYRWTTPAPEPASGPSSSHGDGSPSRAQAPTRPADTTPASPASALADGLAEVARLRRAGEFEAAIAKLDELARAQDDARTLEVISYERGTLVERSATVTVACEAWIAHRRSFPSGRYDAEVERRIAQLACVPK